MSDKSEWSAPDPQAGQGGGGQPGHPQAQDGWGQPMPPPPPGWGGPQPRVAKPGVIPLRPLGLGEILDGAISTIRAYPKLMLGAAAIVVVIEQVIGVAVAWAFFHGRTVTFDRFTPREDILPLAGAILAYGLVSAAITLLTSVFLSGFLTVVVGRAVLGQPASFGQVWAQIRRKLLPLLGLTILFGLIVSVAAIFLVIPAIWLGVLFGLSTAALVLEPVSVGRALGRSRDLVRGSWWRVFGILLVSVIIAAIIGGIIAVPFSVLDSSLNGAPDNQLVPALGSMVLSAIGAMIAGTITYPFISAVHVLLYVDQRMRREGWDIELARMAASPVPPGYPGGP